MSTSPLRSAVIRLAHTMPQYRKVLLACLQDSDKTAKYEEGASADPTENMSPEDAAEWHKQNGIHRDNFKTAGVAHGSKTIKDLTDDEQKRFYEAIDKHGNDGNNSNLAKNLSTKFGLTLPDVLAIIRKRQTGQNKTAAAEMKP